MDKSDFFYELPPELIAQRPADPRDSSRLLCLDRGTGATRELVFHDIGQMLRAGDLLVVNDSRVIPARLIGQKVGSGGRAELLLLKQLDGDVWDCIAKPAKRLKTGAEIEFGGGLLRAQVVAESPDGNRHVEFFYDESKTFFEVLDEVGQMPLPPYITAPLKDNNEYQTVYALHDGSAAAPTAGLHFTDSLLESLQQQGIGLAKVTLHVGLGTFRPVKENDITDHIMHSEWYSVSQQTADAINETKSRGGRVICVGTTSCRTLEAAYQKHGVVKACSDTTDIFIYPSYEFGVMDALITNFHLPESTLIMLVSAFAGYDNTMQAYRQAVAEHYRFFSFGDAMFIY